MPIATGVAWFHDCAGGDFAFYPGGPDAAPVAHRVRYNTAVLLDTDSVFHGVDRVADASARPDVDAEARARDGASGTEAIELLRPGMRLRHAGGQRWDIADGDEVVARYRWDELRFSISWKAYCFRDDAERATWATHADDLTVDVVVDRLLDDLRARGRHEGPRPGDLQLVDLIIDEYIRFPAPRAA
jgi:hypothetical protein